MDGEIIILYVSTSYNLLLTSQRVSLYDTKSFVPTYFLARGLTDVSTAGFSIRCVKTVSVRLCDVCQTYISSFNSAPITTRLR